MRLFILILILISKATAQVSYEKAILIGDIVPTNPALVLEVHTLTKGSIPCPKQTTAQSIARTPVEGECIYNTDLQTIEVWNGSSWLAFGAGGGGGTGGTGDVIGPATSTVNAVPRYASTTGKQLKNSPVIINDTGDTTGIKNLTISGTATINNYSLPTSSGPAGSVLTASGTGTTYWADKTIYTWKGSTLTGYSTNNQAVPYFTTVDPGNNISVSNCATVQNASDTGFSITVAKTSLITATVYASDMTVSYDIGFTKNPTAAELDQGISVLPNNKVLCRNTILGVLNYKGSCNFSQIFKNGDIIYTQIDKVLPLINQDKFTVHISCVLL